MRRAIVHVGLPRTGTTSFQRVMSGLRADLLACGILYPQLTPRSAGQPHLSHQYLGEALDGRRPRADRAELVDLLAHQLATTDADTVLLSYEGFCLAPAWLRVPQRLASLLARHGFAMDVLATIKPQAELVNSAYTWRTQFLREARPFTACFKADIDAMQLDLNRVLRAWRATCDGRIMVVPTRDARSERPLVERILEEAGLLPRMAGMLGPQERTLMENRSPGPVAVEVARQLRQGGAHLSLGRSARDVVRFVEQEATARGANAIPFMGLDTAARAIAHAKWRNANDRFARTVWCEAWSARVVEQSTAASNDILQRDDAAADLRLVADILGETCERYRLRLDRGSGLALRQAASTAASRLARMLRYGRALAR